MKVPLKYSLFKDRDYSVKKEDLRPYRDLLFNLIVNFRLCMSFNNQPQLLMIQSLYLFRGQKIDERTIMLSRL